MEIEQFKKNYLTQTSLLEHSIVVSKLSLKMFNYLLPFFPFLEGYNNKKDMLLLEYSAILHDIGINFERKLKKGHNKIGRDLILKNKITGFDEKRNIMAANIVRYHRRSMPDINKHKYYTMLNLDDRRKVDVFSSIVRLCDAMDYRHFNVVDDFQLEYDGKLNILTIKLLINIMLNIGLQEVLDKKKQFFQKVFNTEVLFI